MKTLFPLVLAYAPTVARADFSALVDLDLALGRIVTTTTEPMIGQMRLTWWHEQLIALGGVSAPSEPVLCALDHLVVQGVVTGDALARMVEGWEVLLEPLPHDDVTLRAFAEHRGDGFFLNAANIIGGPVERGLGAGWALVDFAMNCSDQQTAEKAVEMAREYFTEAKLAGPKPLRILAHISRSKAFQPSANIYQPVGRMMILRGVLR